MSMCLSASVCVRFCGGVCVCVFHWATNKKGRRVNARSRICDGQNANKQHCNKSEELAIRVRESYAVIPFSLKCNFKMQKEKKDTKRTHNQRARLRTKWSKTKKINSHNIWLHNKALEPQLRSETPNNNNNNGIS